MSNKGLKIHRRLKGSGQHGRRRHGQFVHWLPVASISVAAIICLSWFIISVRAAGPFTVSPSTGFYTGGDSITITGSGFATSRTDYDFRSYTGRDDLVIQLDAIQNRRGVPLGVGTAMSGNIAAGTTTKATDTGYFWHDLACTGWTYADGTASKGIDANCYDWIPKYSTGNQPTVVASSTGNAIRLNNLVNGAATTSPAAGFQVSGNFNLATYLNSTSGTYSKAQIEAYHRAQAARSGTAYRETIYEYGTADTTNPGARWFRYASAVATANLTSCFTNQGSGQKNLAFTCANDANWRADSFQQLNRATSSTNSNTHYTNGASVGTSATGTTAFTPAASNNWFIGARSITTTDGSTNLGTIRYNSEFRGWRLYRRALSAQEVSCNFKLDQYRYEGVAISPSDAAACATGAANITGTGMMQYTVISPAPVVTIGGAPCTVTAYSPTSITCTTTAGTVGLQDVVVTPDSSTSLPSQTYTNGFEYLGETFKYEIENTSVNPYIYRIDPASLQVLLSYTHASLVNISFPRTSSNGTATVMNNTVTMANANVRNFVGGNCGGVACNTISIKIPGATQNITGANGLVAFLQSLTWSGGAGFLRGEIRIDVYAEDITYWIDGDGNRHFYELKNSGSAQSWTGAYNYAKAQTFHGLTGYLMSMINQEEADVIKDYTVGAGLSAVGYTAGIRFRQADTAHSKVDGTVGYGGDTRVMPNLPTGGSGTISGVTATGAPNGFSCTRIGTTDQGCSTQVAKVPVGTACPTAAAYDTEWYWANPVDNGLAFFMGRAGGTSANAECANDPINTTPPTSQLVGYWNGAQPEGGEPIMAYQSATGTTFGWHDYTNNAGNYVYVEYSEGWADRGGGEFSDTGIASWSAPIPLAITIHHVRVNTGATLAPDTFAPSMGLNTTTNQFTCNAQNGGQIMAGYVWASSSCVNGLFPYDPTNQSQEITYYYAHQSIANPVPFRMQRVTVGSNYTYQFYAGDVGSAINDFGPIRQVTITYPTALSFVGSSTPSGWVVNSSVPGTINISIPNTALPSDIANYLQTIYFAASGLTNVVGQITIEVADFSDVPSSGDPGRTSQHAALPQPITSRFYRLGQTTDLIPSTETIGLVGASFPLPAPPQYLPLGSDSTNATYSFYQSTPPVGYVMTYTGAAQTATYFYQPANGLTVSFDMNGEDAVRTVPSQLVPTSDNAVRPPEDPIVLGKSFIDWYTTSACTTTFDFGNTQIITDTTIYACFQAESPMTVLFETSSPLGAPQVDASPRQITNIVYNDFMSAPTPPILAGYSFNGWYTEAMTDANTCNGEVWDFLSDRVELETNTATGPQQFTLYVCWQSQPNVTINFNTATGAPAAVQVLPNPASRSVLFNAAPTPPAAPVSEGFAFVSWNTAAMVNATTCGGTVFNFSNRLTAPLTTVFACWQRMANLSIAFQKGTQNGNPAIQDWPTNVNDMPYNAPAATYFPDVTLEGYVISHWCDASINSDCGWNDRFDWSIRRTTSLTLVAIWREDVMTVDEVVPNYGPTTGGNRVTIWGSGFLQYDARSYAQSGLMVLLDGANNAGTLSSPNHNASATVWNNLAPSASTAFGNFNLTNATINPNNIRLNGSSAYAKSAATANLNASIGGTTIAQVTTEVAFRQNAIGASYSQLYEYGPFGYNNTAANNAFGEVLNANATVASGQISTFSSGNCFIGQRTSATAFNGGFGTCANNTAFTTHTSIQSKATAVPRRLVIDGNTATPAVNATNTATAFFASGSIVLGARTSVTAQTTFNSYANIAVSSFRMYNRPLTDQEIQCNHYVDLARFRGVFHVGLSACGGQLVPINPDTVTINGQACTNPTVISDSQLACDVPASTLSGNGEGTVDVYVAVSGGKNATLVNGYTYQAPLAITSLTPTSGPVEGGTVITITGNDFRDLSVPNGVPKVTIGGNDCYSISLSNNNRTLTCTVPASTSGGGPVDVVVSIAARSQQVTLTDGFDYIDSYITMSVDTSNVNITNVAQSTGGFNYGTANVSVWTNVDDGYSMTISTNSSSNTMSNTIFPYTLASSSGTLVSPAALSLNTWAFTLNSSPSAGASIWSAVPILSSPLTIKTTAAPNETTPGDQTAVRFGVRIDWDRAAGTYQTTVIYTALANS